MERILAKLVALSKDLTANQSLELVFDGRTEHLTFYKVLHFSFFWFLQIFAETNFTMLGGCK